MFLIIYSSINFYNFYVNEIPFDNNATALNILYIITAAFMFTQIYADIHNHSESISLKYREKQLENLYLPLKYGLDNFDFDIIEIEKYSYLSSGKLKNKMCDVIKYKKIYDRNSSDAIHYCFEDFKEDISKAIDSDIDVITKDLIDYIEFKN